MDYKCLGGVLTRVSTRPDAVVEQLDYDPYGRPTLGAPSTQQTYIGRQRDLETGLADHGVRKYDPAEGRFHSVDPRWESFRDVSPYQYAHGNPLNRVDANGQWDIVVHVAKDRSQNGYGVAVVTNRKGEEVFRFTVRVEGQHRDRMSTNGDTPLGVYDIPNGASKWRNDRPGTFGPNHRLVLLEQSGEASESGRSAIRIHGGRQGSGAPRESVDELRRTHGCLRAYDQTMKALKEVTDELEASDAEEHGGQLIIMDDLVIEDGVPMIPGDAQSTEEPK